MKNYRIRHDFNKFRPAWTAEMKRVFGERNEGFTIQAASLDEAKNKCRNDYNLNPFYLTITEESGA